MLKARFFVFFFIIFFSFMVESSPAGEVRIFKPMEDDLSRMELQNQAMAEGFAQAVLEEAKVMLPGNLDAVRTELFKQYLLEHAKPYIRGYKILSSQDMDAGLILRLDVKVNRKPLRDGLRRMGLFETIKSPQPATVIWPENMDEDAMVELQGLVTLTGIQVGGAPFPSFTLEVGPKKTYKGHLVLEGHEWTVVNKDMSVVWFELWGRFFTRSELTVFRSNKQILSVSGWFAAIEFDRVLRGWDSAVQEVNMVEMDMQPTGVAASWKMRILNSDRLNMLLQGFLPQRGLGFQLSDGAEK
jgi:hypothetical protein